MNQTKHTKFIRVMVALLTATTLLLSTLASCSKAGFDESKNISVVTREDGSGTKSAFLEIIGLKGKADVSGVIVASTTAAVLTEVKGNPVALAYESLGYVTDEVKMLKVNGVEPTVANIKNGTYSIARPLCVVYKAETVADGAEAAFLTYLQSSQAQTIISNKGYVSIVDNAAAYTPVEGLSGTIDISGSTSLQPLMIELADAFKALQSGVTVTVSGGGSGTGYKNAENGVSAFGMISESFNAEKAPSCTAYTVAKDGIAIIVNLANPIEDISSDDLAKIYDPDAGENAIRTWAELK